MISQVHAHTSPKLDSFRLEKFVSLNCSSHSSLHTSPCYFHLLSLSLNLYKKTPNPHIHCYIYKLNASLSPPLPPSFTLSLCFFHHYSSNTLHCLVSLPILFIPLSSAMEVPEDVMGSHSSSSTGTGPTVLKRKRSNRPPLPSRAPPVVVASSSSTSSTDYLSSATKEEEDMAHCLILLAQGRALSDSSPTPPPAEKFTSRRFTETTTTAGGKAGFYVYECKTCNKCFPSFQALGGHRASHKKPKMMPVLTAAEDNKNLIINDNILEGGIDVSINAFKKMASASSPTNNSNSNKMRVHECSICGAEFTSGQALGGHMRRHRPIGAGPSSPTQEVVVLKKERNVLSLDLNLPAPADENPQPPPPPVAAASLSFADKRPMVFSATSVAALVDCHY